VAGDTTDDYVPIVIDRDTGAVGTVVDGYTGAAGTAIEAIQSEKVLLLK
jgi:hypothetical protein